MVLVCTTANGTGFLVFSDDMSADKNSRINCEVFRVMISAHLQPKASKLIGQSFTVQIFQANCYSMAKLITWAAFHLLKAKLNIKKNLRNQQEIKTAGGKTWQNIGRKETQLLVTSVGSRLKAVTDRKGVIKHIKKESWMSALWANVYYLIWTPVCFGGQIK